jgi:hypothetical protein
MESAFNTTILKAFFLYKIETNTYWVYDVLRKKMFEIYLCLKHSLVLLLPILYYHSELIFK